MKWIVGLLLGLLLSSNIYWFCKQGKSLPQEEQPFERISDNQVFSSVTKVAQKSLSDLLWKESRFLLRKRKLVPEVRTEIKVITEGVKKSNVPSSRVMTKGDVNLYIKDLVDSQGLHRGTVGFEQNRSTSQPTSKPWHIDLKPIEANIEVVKTSDGKILVTGKVRDEKGKESPLKVVDVKTIIARPEVPTHSGGLKPFTVEMFGLYGMGGNQHGPGVGFGTHILHYKYKGKEVLRFLGVVIGLQAIAGTATFHPISYNLGHIIPILKDTYLTFGVGIGYRLNGEGVIPMFSLGIGTTL